MTVVDGSQKLRGIGDVLEALLQPSLRMVVVSKGVRTAGVSLHRDRVPRILQHLTIKFSLVPLQIELGSDNMRWGKALQVGREDRSHDPLIDDSFLFIFITKH